MLYSMIAVALVSVLLHGSLVGQTEQHALQSPAKMQEIVRTAQEKDKSVKVTFLKKVDNQKKLAGRVSEVSHAGFTLTDLKTGKATKLEYQDVKEVRQKGWSKGEKIALPIVIGLAAIVIALTATKSWVRD